MSTHKWIDRICVIVMMLSLTVSVLFMNGEKLGIALVQDTDAESYTGNEYFTANDLNGDWDASSGTVITLAGDSAKIVGNGAYWLNGSLVIVQSGQYVVSGELTDGSIVVDAEQYSKVWILLNGVTVSCSGDACIRVDQADKVFLTLAEGTENTLNGTGSYSEIAIADGVDAVIFSHDDLTINGSGGLTVNASSLNGITAKDDLMITGGTISITAPAYGIKVNDRIHVTAASLTIDAGQDGIHSDMTFLMQDGNIVISADDDGVHADNLIQIYGGSLQITGCYEGLEATAIEQYGGDVVIQARDDGLNANGYTGYAIGEMRGGESDSSGEEQTVVTAEETYVLIAGGTLTITNATGMDADGIDSNGNITVTGGTIRVFMANNNGNSPLDCGTEAGGRAVITGGTVIACGNYSMAESFDSTSGQCSILYNISEGVSAGSVISLLDADGGILLSEEIPYSFSSVILSCPDMSIGSSYRITIGESEEEITLNEISASYGDASSQIFMGAMNWGGMQPRQEGAGSEPPSMPDGESMGNPPSFQKSGADGTPPPRPDGEDFGDLPAFPQDSQEGDLPDFPGNDGNGMQPGFSGDITDTDQSASAESTDDPATELSVDSETNGTLSESTGESAIPAGETVSGDTEALSDMEMTRMEGPGQRQGNPMAEDHGRTDSLTGEAITEQETDTTASDWALIAISALILAAGILFAFCFRRYQHIGA